MYVIGTKWFPNVFFVSNRRNEKKNLNTKKRSVIEAGSVHGLVYCSNHCLFGEQIAWYLNFDMNFSLNLNASKNSL